MNKRFRAAAVAAGLVLLLSACNQQGGGVSVERADMLSVSAQAGERYAGVVVSENTQKVSRDTSKTVKELYVHEGQDVKTGDLLFSYDSDELQLDLEKQNLELEKLSNELTNYEDQLEDLEEDLEDAYYDSDRIQLTLQINTVKTQQLEATYQKAAKEKDIEQLKKMLENVDVVSPVDGRIRKIDEQGTDGAYITIQQTGAYRIKGKINEMNLMNGIGEGTPVTVISRVDAQQTWSGVVSLIDLENPEQNSNSYMYGYVMDSSSSVTNSSTYPFYVELETTEGLLLGQHVYIEIGAAAQEMEGLWVPPEYLVDLSVNEQTGEMTAGIWAANSLGKLEKRTLTLGIYDEMTGAYEVLSGLSAEDYVANPASEGCAAGAKVSYRDASDFTGEDPNTAG